MNSLLTWLERFKLNTKLIIGFSIGIVVAILIGIYGLVSLSEMESDMEKLYEHDLIGISRIKDANLNMIYMSRATRQMLIAQDDVTRDKARSQVQRAKEKLAQELAEGRKRLFRQEAIAQFEAFQRDYTRFLEVVDHAVALIEREAIHPSAAAKFITSPEFQAIVSKADDGLTELTKMKEHGALITLEAAREKTALIRNITICLILLGVLLALLLGVLVGNSIKRPNERIQTAVENLAQGKLDTQVPHTDYPNEIGSLARSVLVLQDIYQQAEAQRWVKTHAAEISNHLQTADSAKSLAQAAISKIAPIIDAGHGALYVLDEDKTLHLLASYGYRERKNLNNKLAIGEGLVGQCALEKSPITLTAPKDYIQINSGLGEAPPACIAILPIIHADRLLGVLELAAFQQFGPNQIALIDVVMPVLATSMEIMDRNMRTRALLTASQEQAERMEKQAAQLEEQAVEMEAQQAELLETENWFRSIIETAPDGILVINEGGTVLLSNPEATKTLNTSEAGLIGKHINHILQVTDSQQGTALEALNQASRDQQTTKLLRENTEGSPVNLVLSAHNLPSRGAYGRCLSISLRPA